MNNFVFKHKEVEVNPNEAYEFEYEKHCLMWNLMGINAEYMCDIYKYYCLPEANKLFGIMIKRRLIRKNIIKIVKNMLEKSFAYDLVCCFKEKCIEELGDDPNKIRGYCYACKYAIKHSKDNETLICQSCPLDWESKLICCNNLSEFSMLIYSLKKQNVDEVRKICYTIRDTKIKTESDKNPLITSNPLPIRKHHKRKVMLKRVNKITYIGRMYKDFYYIEMIRHLKYSRLFDNLNIRIKNV